MLNKLIKEVIIIVVGKQSGEIVDLLDGNKFVNEFLIAKKLDITINQVRNILYKLADQGLVSSIRKKDKRKGWYTYFWKIETLKSLEFLENILIKRIDQITNQIKSRQTKEFYICERCNIEFNEENALLYDFTCNECGSIFSVKDNTKVLKEFNRTLDKLKRKLKLVVNEINKEKDKLEKKRIKQIKKEEKEKARKRAAKRKATKAAKKKAKAKPKKKIIKKKPKKRKVIKKKVKKKAAKKKPKKKPKKKILKKKVKPKKKPKKKLKKKLIKKKTKSKKKKTKK